MPHKKRSDGRLKAGITVGVTPDGKPLKKYVYAHTERELQRKVDELRYAVRTGTCIEPGKMTVSDLLTEWRKRHVARTEPKTAQFYDHMAAQIIAVIGPVKVKDLSPLHIENLIDHYRECVSGTTLHHLYCTLRAVLNKAIRWRLLSGDNPCKGVDPPSRSTKRCIPLSPDEVRRLLAAASGDPLGPLYMLAVSTGMREGELLGLMWSDIDFERGWLRVQRSLEGSCEGEPIFGDPKTDASEREIPLSATLVEALKEHRSYQQVELRLGAGASWRDTGLVFTQRNGGPMNPSNLRNRRWYPLLEKAGLRRIKFHDLRHTAATMMLTDLGYDVKTVQEILGHTESRTTLDLYGHGRDAKKKEAARRIEMLLTAPAHDHLG